MQVRADMCTISSDIAQCFFLMSSRLDLHIDDHLDCTDRSSGNNFVRYTGLSSFLLRSDKLVADHSFACKVV